MICEKPNVAKKIANALGKPKKLSYKGVPYYELERGGKKIIVASAVGHLFTLKESNKKNKKFGEYPVFDINWASASIIKGKEYVKKYIDTLKKLSSEAHEFYVATDWDIEGELIGYHALYYCCGKKDAKRMRFSSLTKEEIIKAYENPDKIDYGLIDAGDSRHKLDWYYGINVSRALMQSIRAVNRWQTMSTGRVQGPALSFLVDRELEIKKFVPKPYWVIGALLKENITAIHEKDKFWDEKEAKEIYNKIKEEKEGIIEKIKKTKKKIKPNPPFDLGTLQREAHRIFKFSPKKTQEIGQKLYEKGLCLHPDTPILTPRGALRIKELEHEGSVLCLNSDLKIVESKYKLLKRVINENLIKIILEDGTSLIATKEHPILTYSNDKLIFIPCEKLREGDNILKIKSENGLKNTLNRNILNKNNKNILNKTQQIDEMENIKEEELNHDLKRIVNGQVDLLRIVKMEYIPYNGEVYDLTVEAYHNFIANNVIVHNCSYPRTSSQKLPEDKEYIKKILSKITAINDYKKYAEVILKSNREPIQGKKKDPAHPAIHFVDVPNEPLPDEEKKLYDLIVRRTLSLFWEDAEREYIIMLLNIKGEIFKLSGSRTVNEGWHEIYYFTKFDEKELPNLRKNDKVSIEKITFDRKETKPPKRYTMSSIIKELETRELGTKATRADIVEKLVKRGYVIEDNSLQVTDLGIAVIETLKKYCPEIIDEKMTRELEKKLDRLQKGTMKKDNLLKNAEKKLRAILEEVKKKEKDIGRELVEKIDTTNKTLKTIGKCKCGGDLKIIKSKGNKRFIGCSNYPECSITYPLPQRGRIKILNEICEVCGSPLIAINKQRLCINLECPSKASEQPKEEIEKSERTCPKCGGNLSLKKGIYGMFYGCENYPKCKYTENLNKKTNSQDSKKIVGKCPKCEGDLIVRSGRFGEFIGCSNYPKCRYTEKIKSNK
ncbi:DNA topoisomerase I [Methanothermococcus sp. SCGC AD-155-M21]|nr:DNA topoisomerase I [Methanothermococcus sp. SCGC AD-155-M21]